MNERAYRLFINEILAYTRSAGPQRWAVGRKIHAGKICSCCETPLPKPHTPSPKRCANCAGKHRVYMSFFRGRGWHCRFTAEGRRALPKRLTFRDSAKIYEVARRGNGLLDDESQKALDQAVELGRGGMWLRLTNDQLEALGGQPQHNSPQE